MSTPCYDTNAQQNNRFGKETIRCKIVRKFYEKDIYRVVNCHIDPMDVADDAVRAQLVANDGFFTARGNGLQTIPGITVNLTGTWEWTSRFNQYQFKTVFCEDAVGDSREDVVRYLIYILSGVGPAIAESIYDTFGENTIRILEEDPQQFLSVPGIGTHRMQSILESYTRNREYTMLTKLLAKYGVTFRMIVSIYRSIGSGAHSLIKDNPYVLCKVAGYGFIRADEIAMSMGTDRHSFNRIAGAIFYAIAEQFVSAGHTFAYMEDLVAACISSRVLNSNCRSSDDKVTWDEVEGTIRTLSNGADLILTTHNSDEPKPRYEVYLPAYYHAEAYSAYAVMQLVNNENSESIDWLRFVNQAQYINGISLDETQLQAAVSALSHNISIITGGPGTGKTTILKCIADAYRLVYPTNTISLAAPTGRASRRMKEQTGYDAKTLHSLMRIAPGQNSDYDEPIQEEDCIDADLLIVDESSMIDIRLFAELMYRLNPGTKLVILGDVDQLPSVGAGNVLCDLINSFQIPVARLTTIHRQGADSTIPKNAAAIRRGQVNLEYTDDFRVFVYPSAAEAVNDLREFYEKLPADARNLFQIISPRKKNAAASVNELNELLQAALNPPTPFNPGVNISGITYRVDDPVIITHNSEFLSNGDTGRIVEIRGRIENEESFRVVLQINGSPMELSLEQALDMNLAYAITVHKSQGSEFPGVVIPIFNSMGAFFLQRNLLYTAVTRARKRVIILTDSVETISKCILTENTGKRNSNLVVNMLLCRFGNGRGNRDDR